MSPLALVPHALHVVAWWGLLSSLVIAWWVRGRLSPFWRGWVRGTVGGYATVAVALLFISGCPPAHSATLRWNMPTTHEGFSPRGQRCLAGADLTTDSLWAFVTRQPLVGVPVCVARLRCARGAHMRWAVPDSQTGAWFDVVASTGKAHSCSGNVVWIAEAPGFRAWWFGL